MEIITVSGNTATILVPTGNSCPRKIAVTVLIEHLPVCTQQTLGAYFPYKVILRDHNRKKCCLWAQKIPTKPEFWQCAFGTVYTKEDTEDFAKMGISDLVYTPVDPEHTEWLARGKWHRDKNEAILNVLIDESVNTIKEVDW